MCSLMNYQKHFSRVLCVAGIGMLAAIGLSQTASAAKPYKIVKSSQTMGTGGLDYVYADNDGRRLYVPRGNQIHVFNLDTLKPVGNITNTAGRGVAVDPKTHHGFCSSSPVTMFDTTTLEVTKRIPVQGKPDGILFEPATEKIYVMSHKAPNVTVIDARNGSIAGTIDLGGGPEQGASDAEGHVYIELEEENNIAVVDANTLKVTGRFPLPGRPGPAGLGLDAKNHILFAMCHDPQKCYILSADDGKILTTLPIAGRSDGGGFNPNTMEAFSSHKNGTLTIIKENSPTSFEVEQDVQTKDGAKTCTLDRKNNRIIVITTEQAPATAVAAGATPGGARRDGPSLLDVLVIGR